jgi:hypothetical protein
MVFSAAFCNSEEAGVEGLIQGVSALLTRDRLVKNSPTHTASVDEESSGIDRRFDRKIAGVGVVVGSSVLNTLERVPFRSADAFVGFTGLDPRPDESGHHRGRRRLSKRGPSELRRLLYLAAMAAAKTKTWEPLYQHYRAKGQSTTATLVILARRIARTAWSIYTHKTEFDPKRLTKGLT